MPAAYESIVVTLETSQRPKSQLKAAAPANMLRAPRAERGRAWVRHACAERGAAARSTRASAGSTAAAHLFILVTLETSQRPKSQLKAAAFSNML